MVDFFYDISKRDKRADSHLERGIRKLLKNTGTQLRNALEVGSKAAEFCFKDFP